MNAACLVPARCFAALLVLPDASPAQPDLADLARRWPRALAVRALAAMPLEAAVAGYVALPNRLETARVGQLLRAMALDKATQRTVGDHLAVLSRLNYGRAATLRRDMEWEGRDAVFFPPGRIGEGDELQLYLAVLADEVWDELMLPNTYRLPAPKDSPDAWPPLQAVVTPLALPERIPDDAAPLRAGIEWLHLWRLDASLADEIWQAVPQDQAQAWLQALFAVTDPASEAPLADDVAMFEHVDSGENVLSQIEVDALLRGVSDPPLEAGFELYPAEARACIRTAVQRWIAKAGCQAAIEEILPDAL